MELDALKEQINRRLEDPVSDLRPDIAAGTTRSHSLLHRLGRNLRIELALYFLCLAFVAWQMWGTTHTALRIYDATLFCLVLMVMWRIRQIIRRIDHQLGSGDSIREHLAELLDILEANSRQYLLLSVGIIPFLVMYAVLLFHFFPIRGQGMSTITETASMQSPPLWVFVAVAVILTALLTGISYLLCRLYIWWMFGKHIRGLRESLRDLESDPEE